MLTLYQAEWCPFSSAVREVLTELGIDFVARQVEPFPEQRDALRKRAGTDQMPVLEAEDGSFYRGTRQIFAYLRDREGWRFAAEHRRRYADHVDARESDAAGQLLEYFRGADELEAADGAVDDAVVVHVPEKSRYELRLDGRLIGLAAYHRRDDRFAFTHTEVDPACEGRGFGSRLVRAVLDDARREGVQVVPLCPFVGYFVSQNPEYADVIRT